MSIKSLQGRRVTTGVLLYDFGITQHVVKFGTNFSTVVLSCKLLHFLIPGVVHLCYNVTEIYVSSNLLKVANVVICTA